MTVATSEKTIARLQAQMELPIAALLKRRAEFARGLQPGAVRGQSPGPGRPPGRRRDVLPERMAYQDDGCEIHPQCLTCPLPRCRYDEPGGLNGMLTRMRDSEIVRLRRDGAQVEQIADTFGVSRRTVFRVLTTKQRAGRPAREARCA